MRTILAWVMTLMACALSWALEFTQEPSLTGGGAGKWLVEFGLSETTDVEVAIVDMRDSTIVRHLAAGVLGANPPLPLVKDSLRQRIEWDGKDDFGIVATSGTGFAVRVRAGMGVKLDKMVGGNDYAFRSDSKGKWAINGMTADKSGNIYIYGTSTPLSGYAIRQYDPSGNYLKTVFPFPSNLNASQVSGFGINNLLNGRYSPKMGERCMAQMSSKLVAEGGTVSLLPLSLNNEIAVSNLTTIMFIGTDGGTRQSNVEMPFITSPALPSVYHRGGPAYVCSSQDEKWYYLSGFYQTSQNNAEPVAPTGGFWQDGQVIKVNVLTGAAQPFIRMDSVPTTFAVRKDIIGPLYGGYGAGPNSAFHGVTIDDSGHVFVADRFHGRVSVYDTNAVLLGSVPVRWPDAVAVDKKTGAIFVTSRILTAYYTGAVTLFKFSGWRSSPPPICSLRITTNIGQAAADKSVLMTSESGGNRYVWLAYNNSGVQVFRDDGNTLAKVKDFYAENSGAALGFTRLAVDRNTNTAFVQDSWDGLFKVEDWTNPVVRPCSTSARKRLMAQDMTVSPDGQLYVLSDGSVVNGPSAWAGGPIHRYSIDHFNAPIPFPNTGSNMMVSWIYGKQGVGYGVRGLCVSTEKKLAAMYMYNFPETMVGQFADSGTRGACVGGKNDSTLRPDTLIKPVTVYCGGVQYDYQGNLYAGVLVRSTKHVTTPGFEGDNGYNFSVGSVVRIPKGNKSVMPPVEKYCINETRISGQDRVYLPGLGAISGPGSDGDHCGCRSPRFEVDPYGRLFIPNAVTQQISVVDNNDNPILIFGEYGNRDAAGPGSRIPDPAVPLAFPGAVATSDGYIYIADEVNTRLVRVKMDYALENIKLPEVALSKEAPHIPFVRLAAAPNPFNPATTLVFGLATASRVTLKVYDARGRMSATVWDGPAKAGENRIAWNAAGLPSGVYVARLFAQGRVQEKRITLLK